MKRREYSAGAVKFSFWFMEFRKVVDLLSAGKTLSEIKELNDSENIFGAPTSERSKQIWSTVSSRVKMLDGSFYPIFSACDVASQKMFALVAAMAHDTLFAEFIYEVVREKMIIGNLELTDSDVRIFFKNKQEQSEKVAKWTDYTLTRLGRSYRTMLVESGLIEQGKETRKIIRPILDFRMEEWLMSHDMEYYYKAIEGVR